MLKIPQGVHSLSLGCVQWCVVQRLNKDLFSLMLRPGGGGGTCVMREGGADHLARCLATMPSTQAAAAIAMESPRADDESYLER